MFTNSTFSFAGELIEAPITWYNVEKNRKYRFRVINVGTIYPFRVSIDEHNVTVIASDGYDLKPQLVESFVINPGERFDFLLETLYSGVFNVLKRKKIPQMKKVTCFQNKGSLRIPKSIIFIHPKPFENFNTSRFDLSSFILR